MRRILALTAAGLLAVLCVPATVDAAAEATGTVRAVVKYKTNDGNEPLAGVEVFLGIGGSESMMGCTDERGVARFVGVPARTDLISATGVAVSPLRETDCMTNPDFRNPDNGRFMLTDWVDPFRVRAGETARIRFVVTTPANQRRVCAGGWTTWVGTPGRDRFTGTRGGDVVNGAAGNDSLEGGRGFDQICGGRGNDTVRGNRGWDAILLGGAGDDVLVAGPGGAIVLIGGPGVDRCVGEPQFECES